MPALLLILGLCLLCVFPPAGIVLIILGIAVAVIFPGKEKIVVHEGRDTLILHERLILPAQMVPAAAAAPGEQMRQLPAPPPGKPTEPAAPTLPVSITYPRLGFRMLTFATGLGSLLGIVGFLAGMQYARHQADVDAALAQLISRSTMEPTKPAQAPSVASVSLPSPAVPPTRPATRPARTVAATSQPARAKSDVAPPSQRRSPTTAPVRVVTPTPTGRMLGASKSGVDRLLQTWSVREDKSSTAATRIFRYTDDVTLVIGFRGGKAIGVAAIDRPGAGVNGIPSARYVELVRLIGQGPATAGDVKRDEVGIREFYVGETSTW